MSMVMKAEGNCRETSARMKKEGGSSNGLQKRFEAPLIPGRPVFTFSSLSKKSIPSKWEDGEKWLMGGGSPAHLSKSFETQKLLRQRGDILRDEGAFGAEIVIGEDEVREAMVSDIGGLEIGLKSNEVFHGFTSEIFLQDTFSDIKQPVLLNFRYADPFANKFLLKDSHCETMENWTAEAIAGDHRRNIGTEMTPLGSTKSSRCHTPMKSSSPPRHNTPADRSGPLVAPNSRIDVSELRDCHFAKLKFSAQCDSLVSHWGSREEDDYEISKSLKQSGVNGGGRIMAQHISSLWEKDERSKRCFRYQREEAKIHAWVRLQTARAEAQSKKLEVKIQKMRSNSEEKLMKSIVTVHRRSEEWRAAARLQHSQQILRVSERTLKLKDLQNVHISNIRPSCGCFSTQQ